MHFELLFKYIMFRNWYLDRKHLAIHRKFSSWSPTSPHCDMIFIYRWLSQVIARNTLSKLIYLICRHNDLPWNVRKFVHNQLGEVNLSSDLGRVDPWARSDWSHTDIPRLRAGLVGAQVNSIWDSLSSPFSLSPPPLSLSLCRPLFPSRFFFLAKVQHLFQHFIIVLQFLC